MLRLQIRIWGVSLRRVVCTPYLLKVIAGRHAFKMVGF